MTVLTRLSGTDYPLKVSAKEYLALADAGLFDNYGRTELIEGEIWAMNAVHRWLARNQIQFAIALTDALKAGGIELIVYGAGGVAMSDDSIPEPDISAGSYEPSAREPISLWALKLAIELADSTRSMDLGRKAALYARCGVPEYWVADREEQVLVRHARPSVNGYAAVDSVPFGEAVISATLDGLTVDTACLLD
jgi:Uma2 family endonuclease